MKKVIRYLAAFALLEMSLAVNTYAVSLESKYPSYSYVFNEFDVDESYLYDASFISFVSKNEHSLKAFYQRSLERGEEILPMMQGQLLNDGVSDLFIYLSMIESGFTTDIVSSKKAVGLWQFMPATAKYYNLIVCQNYDERCDAVSATTAAIKHLNRLHKKFGKWYLAAMAYNCGEGCVNKAIKKAGTDDIRILTDNHLHYLPKETRDYIKKILLIAMIGESSMIGLEDFIENDNGLIHVEVDGATSMEDIAKLIKMDKKELFKLNPNVKAVSKNSFYKIAIPIEKVYAFYLRYDIPLVEKEEKSHMITHTVVMGDTLESIAKLYDADVDEIRVANHLEFPFLTLDTLLVIPVTQIIFEKLSQ
ncbi:lytic transglycosylase [cyanobacterium G8-9]|nr:lytic transglycosylase [cyanobacterium G8-9]